MTTTRGASWIVQNLKWKLAEIFEEHVDGLFDELDSLDLISVEECLDFYLKDSQTEKAVELINLVLRSGEAACEKFLNHLENMILRFPALSALPPFLEDRSKHFQELLQQLNLEKHLEFKLTLGDVLSIGTDNLSVDGPQCISDVPRHFLTKIIGLNRTARNIQVHKELSKEETDDVGEQFFSVNEAEDDSSCYIHPLDVLCALLHCSDSFLQQEILSKMSMCQFAVPLLLPAGDGSGSTFMLWAMREIVKKWRPQSLADSKGFMEDNVVNIEMPIFSFVRLGPNKLSKSKVLNQVLNPPQQHHDFFIHDNMEGGNIERKISDGLVEMSWYFPAGKSDVFPEPIAVANLRGDLEDNWEQFTFLTRISSATFIFIESLCERQFRLLSSYSPSDTKFYFIVTSSGPGKDVSSETQKHLKKLMSNLKICKKQFIVKRSKANDAEYVKNIQNAIEQFLKEDHKKASLESLKKHRFGLHIDVDENLPECQKARAFALNITAAIKNVAEYKKKALSLQGDLWKKVSKIEKELCRMTNLGDKGLTQYQNELLEKRISLHKEQNEHDLSEGIMLFINALTHLSQNERHYFLKWMKLELESISRNNVSALQNEYKEKCSKTSDNLEELKHIDQKISDSSLGIEHFLRELGQFYEAESSMKKQNLLPENRIQFAGLPEMASNLLLGGFPLELIDGDASNIPLQWITDVLTELDKKTGGRCRMRVITVLGVQSTGKSTLLNTMFGLQFPVASGRCTRGAFMTLIKVKENFQEELGCEFILVIDTEGLKAPELSSLDDSYEHDNELATLVVGLSNITIVNMAMENTTEMKDILQIVVHAFLRMKEIGKKPNCQFVHQNVSDVSAHDKNMRDRKKLLEQLDEMTKVAAKMEKKSGMTRFGDVMDYDLERHNWYIPGLWQGVPPMAPVNFGYSENIYKLKQDLFTLMKTQNANCNIQDFIVWVKSLWNSVKHEKFIFSFRNSLVAEAYGNLSTQFSYWEWEFSKKVHKWINSTENHIKNQMVECLDPETYEQHMWDLQQLLIEEENKMLELLENYFDGKTENVYLVERYREDFRLSVTFLKQELERKAIGKYNKAVALQKGKFEVHSIQSEYQQVIEDKITQLLEDGRHKKHRMTDQDIEMEFENMWDETMSTVHVGRIKHRNVSRAILKHLMNDLGNKGSAINENIKTVKILSNNDQWKMNEKYINRSQWSKIKNKFVTDNEPYIKLEEFAQSLIDTCNDYISEKMNSDEDYDDTYCRELLQNINEKLSQRELKKIEFSMEFEKDIKLFIFGRAAGVFQEMHNRFVQKNDPINCLNELKPQYFWTFLKIFREKDEGQSRAKEFCEKCLKPALAQYVYSHLGERIVDDILHGPDNKIFSTRTFFQYTILETLLAEMSFQKFVKYIASFKKFSEEWIKNYILKKYNDPSTLEEFYENILSFICKKVQNVLRDETCLTCTTISQLLQNLCDTLQTELVIPQNELKVIVFGNTSDVEQFSVDVQSFLTETEEQILSDLKAMSLEPVLSRVTVSPRDELIRKVIGCGHQCPFCKVPCEAGGGNHKQHFASVHRPKGLGKYRWNTNKKLVPDICTTAVVSETKFCNLDTDYKYHPFKEYRTYYPDWSIQPDPSIESSDYWKYIFAQFNKEFAKEYDAISADLPSSWRNISKDQALLSLKKIFNVS